MRCEPLFRVRVFVPVELTCPVTAAPQDLAGEQQEQWQDGLHQLKDLGMDDALAEKCLKRGFGWSSQAYWWKDKVNDVPKPGEVKNSAASDVEHM